MDIDDVTSKGKKRAIADERTGIDGRIENGGNHHGKRVKDNRKITTDGRSLVDGITVVAQKNKKGSDVNSDGDIVDESNSFRLTAETLKENNIHKSCHSSQSYSLGAAIWNEQSRNINSQ
uniref:Ovule protein n=1 Tax=Strongyloides venezuelensis TaxID=75913 RepID=A0A0K0FZH9_STRVS